MKNVHELNSVDEIECFLKKNQLSLLYVSRPECTVCHAILPKVLFMLEVYPEIHVGHIDANVVEQVAERFLVFTVPTIMVFITGKEYLRTDRFVRFEHFSEQINNMYHFLFG
ncbi:Thioredoxin [compost metagenome]